MVGKKKQTMTSEELCERYGVTLRTIHHMERKKGFPLGSIFSKALVWSHEKVMAWEREHMPHLHAGADIDENPEQLAEWEKHARMRALDREGTGEAEPEPPPKKKTKRSRSRKPK